MNPLYRDDHPINRTWSISALDELIIQAEGRDRQEPVMRLFGHKGDMRALANHIIALHNATLDQS